MDATRQVTLLDIIENLSGNIHQYPFQTKDGVQVQLHDRGVLVMQREGPPVGVRSAEIRRIQELLKQGGVITAKPEERVEEPKQWTVDVFPKPNLGHTVKRPEILTVGEVLYRKKTDPAAASSS